ncbi:Aste57867_14576 [Aphanomyces stellatus]|uniref:Aste57867_14576 protein n=1 Tax=Aphanomyces stellatus TaxID=120398 RepID=A0A485L1C7_9STRA|nr:hypothetical protein As57867_014522 [Aphanomyces stellatus]VFT91395.1 Aste57867_14576 [Aphanomyces stellatus]
MGSKGFSSLRDAYLVLPYTVTLRNTGATTLGAVANRYCTALKCGVWNVIDSLAVELDGKSILTENDYKLYWNNIRCQTEWSSADLDKRGADAFVAPDDWNSMAYTNVASANGDGFCNNFSNETATAGIIPDQTQFAKNEGYIKRAYANPQPTGLTNGAGVNPYNWITQRSPVATQIASQNGKGSFIYNATPATTGQDAGVWFHIRLVDLHPIFKEFDLMANPSLKLRIRCNAGFSDIAVTGAAAGTAPMSLTSTTMTSGNTVPVMLASALTGNAMSGVLPTSGTTSLRLAFGPLENSLTTIKSYFPFSTARLMVPFYDIANPTAIVSKPVKKVTFSDCYAQFFQQRAGVGINATAQMNSTFNLQLSAFQKNIKQVIVIPFSETSSGHYATAQNIEQFRSPFDTAPWTCQPGSALRNVQVQIGNDNVWNNVLQYDYEMFNDEFSKLAAVNGGFSHELPNGLIDMQKFSTVHRYVVADCSRFTNKDVPQSIQVSGTNASCQGANLLVLVIYERELSFDRLTGELEISS